MSSDVNEIIDLFITREARFRSWRIYLFESSFEKWSLLLAILSLVTAIILLFLGCKGYSIYFLILCYLFVFAYVLSTAVGAFTFIFSAKRSVLNAIKINNESSSGLVHELAKYKVESLKYVKCLFEKHIAFLTGRASFLVGAMDKLGVFPALFMLYYTYTQLPKIENNTLNLAQIWALSFLGGLYIGMLLIKSIIDTLQNYILRLEQAIDEASEFRLP
ncbi:hypothetical protein RHA02_003433 [Vibrio cholerae]|uniref:ABC transmembrane type-1 domain-containing protein n=2 Tax=Vibrio tarriae TaxID=2014742 RepID=A0AAU8W8Z7_9VIBR|nr:MULTISPECIES: hypothetical protein [Vibrio]ASK53399.1 hypothetical protein CEQ48_00720 [Vibrio tarriae]EGQ7944538.1 hypothetical protein [Vibrio cholerae]EJL6894625.1 hypothetical protein [Vibrio cholerae]ELB8603664.1 hypothetical protein [Vibrio cholerae]MCX9575684.1 hypothetical protein [Vibrio cholerae]